MYEMWGIPFFAVAMALFQAVPVLAQKGGLEAACKTQIAKTLRVWSVASVTADVAQWTRARRANPTLARGDFDGDGRFDIALLIQNRPEPVLDYPERAESSLVAVCLGKPRGVILHLIEKPYCSDFIERAPTGQRYFDFETEKSGNYPLDGVRTVCFEKASGTYIYGGTGFRLIVDGD